MAPPFRHLFRTKHTKRPEEEEDDPLADLEIGKELGRGGFAVVMQVHQRGQADGHDVAMRVTPLAAALQGPHITTVELLRGKLEFALNMHKSIRSKHILRFYEYRILKNELVTFSILCKGGDLFEKIISSPNGYIEEDEARNAAYGLCEAIAECHERGIIHRDVKPENLLLPEKDSKASDLLLADFGCCISRTNPQATHTGQVGSPGYIPPEMIKGEPYNMLVDEWSIGITIYEMLTGRSPLISQTPEELAKETLEREIPFPKRYWSNHSPEAKDFVRKLLNKDPKQRMSVEQSFQHPWFKGGKVERQDSEASDTSDASGPDPSAPLINRKTTSKASAEYPDVQHIYGVITGSSKEEVTGLRQYNTTRFLASQNGAASDSSQTTGTSSSHVSTDTPPSSVASSFKEGSQ